jgi:ribosomal protein S18 acetylase RimI-like enzyme
MMTMADNSHQDRELSLGALEPHHAHAVHSLYLRIKQTTPNGFLAEKSADDFEEILSNVSASVSVGAWAGEKLAGYVLGTRETETLHPDSPLIRYLYRQGGTLCTGKGAIVDPQYRGQRLYVRLLLKRLDVMRENGLSHITGLVAVSNLRPMAHLLEAGGWMTGLEKDEYCLNFVTYNGEYCRSLASVDEATVPVDDLKTLQVKFDTGWVATRLRKSGPTHEFILHRIPALEAA